MRTQIIVITCAILTTASLSLADVLKFKQGGAVQGILISANSSEIVFMGLDSKQKSYPVNTVSGIDFAPLPAPKPAAPAGLTVPAGTQISVRMIDAIDGKTGKPGATYRASIDDPVGVGSQVAIPRGANCTVEIVSLQSGDEMALRLKAINIAGKNYLTSTEYAQVEATGTSKKRKALRRGVGMGAVGAGIGALAGGGEGAAIGAAVAGGIGVISAAGAKGKQINVPSEARVIFALKAPLPMN